MFLAEAALIRTNVPLKKSVTQSDFAQRFNQGVNLHALTVVRARRNNERNTLDLHRAVDELDALADTLSPAVSHLTKIIPEPLRQVVFDSSVGLMAHCNYLAYLSEAIGKSSGVMLAATPQQTAPAIDAEKADEQLSALVQRIELITGGLQACMDSGNDERWTGMLRKALEGFTETLSVLKPLSNQL